MINWKTNWKQTAFSTAQKMSRAEAYLENFDYNLLIVCNVYSLEHFTVFSTSKLSHQLVVILIPAEQKEMRSHKTAISSAIT